MFFSVISKNRAMPFNFDKFFFKSTYTQYVPVYIKSIIDLYYHKLGHQQDSMATQLSK